MAAALAVLARPNNDRIEAVHSPRVGYFGHWPRAPFVLGLIYLSAHPLESVPPDAMVVDIVPPDEAPRLSGTPSDLRSSGSQSSSNGAGLLRNRNRLSRARNRRSNGNRLRSRSRTPVRMRHSPRSHSRRRCSRRWRTLKWLSRKWQRTETSEPQAAPPQREETPDQPGAAELMAQLALVGGPLGGGFAAPPVGRHSGSLRLHGSIPRAR